MHIHSTFSDGINSVEENVRQAETVGLARMCCVDHVRTTSDWIPQFVNAVENVRLQTSITVFSGVEAKILNEAGQIDAPSNLDGIDYIYAADHQVPLGDTFFAPREIRAMLKENSITKNEVIASIINSTVRVMENYQNVVIAHLFSVLPKIGFDETDVSEKQLKKLADTARRNCVKIEIDERWKCPSFRTVSYFKAQNIPIWFSSDSHRRETIGRYDYNARLHKQLRAAP